MSVLLEIARDLPDIFRVLLDRFEVKLQLEDEHWLSLQSPRCRVGITFERYGSGFFVSIASPRDKRDRYDYLLVMIMRFPDYRSAVRQYDDSLSEAQNVRCDLEELCGNLVRYCSDLLSGDFAVIRREGYHEFESYIQSRTPTVMNVPADDPIRAKFWRGDFTWVKDLQEREQRSGF